MPTGKPPVRRPARGYTYLLLLFVLAIGGAGLAALGQRWQTLAQRERETELIWRGLQLRDAIERYLAASPAGTASLPPSLQDLLEDQRQPVPRHWLRQLYPDPFTGAADWVLLRHPEGGIQGVASRSARPALRRHGLPAGVTVVDTASPRVSDWQFKVSHEPPPKARASPGTRSTR